jgi:hypothetical protein
VPATIPAINDWVGIIFYVPAVAGGIFGCSAAISPTCSAGGACSCGASCSTRSPRSPPATRLGLLAALLALLHVCRRLRRVRRRGRVAVELFPNPKQRESIVGYTQVLGSFGGLMVTGAYYLAGDLRPQPAEVRGGHEAWRYTLMSGSIPAIPLILIRPFLPESPTWRAKKRRARCGVPASPSCFQPRFRQTTIVTTVMMAAAYAGAFGAIQQAPRIVPGLPELRGLPRAAIEQTVSACSPYQEFGGLAGRFLLAFLAVRISAGAS